MASPIRSAFVDDLIPLILEASQHWWKRDYLRLAHVSPAWLYYVRKRLYACPHVSSFAASTALARTLHENPQLLAFVSGLELEPVATRCHDAPVTGVDVASIQYLLGMEGLKRVKLGGELARRAERFLNSMAYPDHVEELIVDGGRLSDPSSCSGELQHTAPATLEWDESMLYRFPSLQKLQLANLELDVIPPLGPCDVPINHLILDNIDILEGGFVCQMIGAVGVLEISAKSAREYDEQVRLVLQNCDVRELRYEVRGDHRAERSFLEADNGAAGLQSLRRLRLVGHPVDNGMLAAIVQRCEALQELVIGGRCVSITAQEWKEFVTSGAVSSLERLGLPGGSHLPPFVKWSPVDLQALQEASASHRIQLVN